MPAFASDRSSASFELLSQGVRRWIGQQGWDKLHDIQERAIPALLEGTDDVIIAAPTAGGKTEAAFLPIVSRIAGHRGHGFKALYLSPLKALINDQFRRLDPLCRAVDVPLHRWHGDVQGTAKARARKSPDGILLITPESLEALLVRRGFEIGLLFAPLQAIVIDELHAFVGSERGLQLQSLLHRLELAIGRPAVRVGLSATLGDLGIGAEFLRPRHGKNVVILESQGGQQAVLVQLRGHVRAKPIAPNLPEAAQAGAKAGGQELACDRAITRHVLGRLRGKHNLIFARSRSDVELYADLLRRHSEAMAVPNEFYPHHANLSRTEREYIEERLRDHASPTTAVCTSTLELGIDIGEVETVAQIGAPHSVASLRQRLGRSGRRAGKAAVMRLYITERAWRHDLHPAEALRCELVQAIATIRLLVAGWSEKPRLGTLHLSTLVHQVLAIIAQYGGATANRAYAILCRDGPFAAVTPALFSRVLRAIGSPEAKLIEQASDGTLLLGETGERLVAHHDFYAVFQTPEEYRVICNSKELGTLPIVTILIPEMSIIFSGRRWQILDVHHKNRTILVSPGNAGVPPLFGGEAGELDDAIVAEMRRVYESDDMPRFLNQAARTLLAEGRQAYRDLGLIRTNILGRDDATFLFPWAGTVAVNTLVLALKAAGISASVRRSIIEVEDTPVERVRTAITHLATSPPPDAGKLAGQLIALRRQKYDRFLSPELLILGFAADQLAPSAVGTLARTMMGAPN